MFQRMALTLCGILAMAFAAVAGKAEITNGGFESGDLAGWSVSGNGNVQVLTASQIVPFGPTEGTYFALVGNGPGDAGNDGLPDTETLVSDAFTVTGAGTLQLDYDFLTAEFTGSNADPMRLDSFSISLLSPGTSGTLLDGGDVSLPGFSFIDAGNAVAAPDGTSVIEHTGIRTGSALLAPGTYALIFRVDDAGDGSFDSALLVDHVRFTPAMAVPEPGVPVLVMSGGLGCLVICIRRRWA